MYMKLIRDSWNKDSYKEFIEYLFEIRDIKYRDFHSKLGVGNNVIGIRTPILKNIAKDISKGIIKEFLVLLREDYYEEVTLYGLISESAVTLFTIYAKCPKIFLNSCGVL